MDITFCKQVVMLCQIALSLLYNDLRYCRNWFRATQFQTNKHRCRVLTLMACFFFEIPFSPDYGEVKRKGYIYASLQPYTQRSSVIQKYLKGSLKILVCLYKTGLFYLLNSIQYTDILQYTRYFSQDVTKISLTNDCC